jgi:geranylgeranyl reductase family protein
MSARELVDEAEVVVVGGGPSGSVAAATLAELGHEVLLVDQSGFPRDKPCGDGLTHAAVAFLEQKGLGELLEESQPIEDVRVVVGHDHDVAGWYRPWPTPPAYGRTIPRRALDSTLFDMARSGGARFLQGRVDRPLLSEGSANGVALTGVKPGDVSARCVIAADGATSRIRRTSGFPGERPGSRVYALRLYASTEETLDPVFDIYVPLLYDGGLLAGYGWVFPIGPRRANIGVAYYEPPPGRPRARIRRVLDSFLDELQQREGKRLGAISEPTEPIGAPIATQFSPERCQLGNLIFAGEAARAADPLSGEGISFALDSGRYAAEEAHGLLRSRRAPRQGERIGRRFTRLGQDLTLPARMAAAAPTGLSLVERRHLPYMRSVQRVTSFEPDPPSFDDTDIHRSLVEEDGSATADLERLNDRLLDSLRTSFPFALEVMHRQVRANGGPFAAAVALATARAIGGRSSEEVIAAGEACELLELAGTCYPQVADRTSSEVGRVNNALAMLTGQHALARAMEAAEAASPATARGAAAVIRGTIERLAAEAAPGASPTPEAYLATAGWRSAEVAALAATSAASIADGLADTERLAEAARQLGIAWRIGIDIRDLTLGDEVAGRPPGDDLRGGRMTLPLIYAIEADDELANRLRGKLDGAAARECLARARASGGFERAAEHCLNDVRSALEMIEMAGLSDPAPLARLGRLCLDRLPVAV